MCFVIAAKTKQRMRWFELGAMGIESGCVCAELTEQTPLEFWKAGVVAQHSTAPWPCLLAVRSADTVARKPAMLPALRMPVQGQWLRMPHWARWQAGGLTCSHSLPLSLDLLETSAMGGTKTLWPLGCTCAVRFFSHLSAADSCSRTASFA